ncbi:MAG: glycoside hydrolase family 3 N-terminal domain-containing protein [Halocynthiibacter sp.]
MSNTAAIFGCEGLTLSPKEAAFFRAVDPAGFILFGRNIETPTQLLALTTSLRDAVGWNAPILIDQEGGRVERMSAPHWRIWQPMLDEMQRAGVQAGRIAYLRNRIIAHDLQAVGIDVNCAPCADIAHDDTHAVLRNRCCGFDAKTVIENARQVARGLLDGGVLPVLKHIPGHGRATLDSHKDLPHVGADFDTLQETDFAVFRALNDCPMGMSAHIVFDAIDPNAPATTSAKMMGVIRTEIGFEGLLMSDDISMEALNGTIEIRAQAALRAGCDVVLHCNGTLTEMEKIAQNCPKLSEISKKRLNLALDQRISPSETSREALEFELERLTTH